MYTYVPMEEIEKALIEYQNQKQMVANRNDEPEIQSKMKEFEQKLREDYALKKQEEIHEIDISIEAVERIKAKAIEEVNLNKGV